MPPGAYFQQLYFDLYFQNFLQWLFRSIIETAMNTNTEDDNVTDIQTAADDELQEIQSYLHSYDRVVTSQQAFQTVQLCYSEHFKFSVT